MSEDQCQRAKAIWEQEGNHCRQVFRAAQAQIEQVRVIREYLAAVHGQPKPEQVDELAPVE